MEERPCLFCEIVAKRSPATIIYEDQNSVAFLDIHPANLGHTLLVSKQHFETIMDIPDEQIKELAVAIRRISSGLVKAMQADGLNILQNNKRGKIIPHVHFHLIPRYTGDGLDLGILRQGEIHSSTMQMVGDEIKSSIPAE